MVEHITVVIALLDIPHLEEPRSRSHFGKRIIARDVAATRNFSEPAFCKAESTGISNAAYRLVSCKRLLAKLERLRIRKWFPQLKEREPLGKCPYDGK